MMALNAQPTRANIESSSPLIGVAGQRAAAKDDFTPYPDKTSPCCTERALARTQ